MVRMTDEEAERLDEYYTKNTIMPVGGHPGPISRLKNSLRPGEVLSFKCVIEDDEAALDGVFDGAAKIWASMWSRPANRKSRCWSTNSDSF